MEEENIVQMDKQEKVPSDKEADAMVQKWGHKCLDLIQEMADANVPPAIGAFVLTETALNLSLTAGLPGIKLVVDRLSEQLGSIINKENEMVQEKADELVGEALSEIEEDKK
jgi:hypothetical protein|tara:strand:- start:780 stop:1115 length:336 start_codon:yes stop_codon:yes gene_type:complete